MTVSANNTLLNELSTQHLPVLPPGAPGLLKALTEDEIDFNQLAQIIERFPTIAARILVLANSAWSAPAQAITSLQQACSRLGLNVVRSTSIALAVASPFNPRRCQAFDSLQYWTAALMTAEAASTLAAMPYPYTDPFTARTGGLLHNLGLLWLADQLPQQVDEALSAAGQLACDEINPALIARLGFDSAEAGKVLGEAWGLPPAIVTVMAEHPHPDYRGNHWEFSHLVGLARKLVSANLAGNPIDPQLAGFQALEVPEHSIERIGHTIEQQQAHHLSMAEALS